MLTAFLAALVIGQSTMPTAHPSTWDGVPGSDVIQTDPETGEITYPMGQQPPDALALRCVFGRSNVRCPKPVDLEAEAAETAAVMERWRNTGSERRGALGFIDKSRPAMTAQIAEIDADPSLLLDTEFRPIDIEALTADAISPPGQDDVKDGPSQPEPPARAQSGCRREEYRSPDGTSSSFRVVCGSGDQRLLDDVMDAIRPN